MTPQTWHHKHDTTNIIVRHTRHTWRLNNFEVAAPQKLTWSSDLKHGGGLTVSSSGLLTVLMSCWTHWTNSHAAATTPQVCPPATGDKTCIYSRSRWWHQLSLFHCCGFLLTRPKRCSSFCPGFQILNIQNLLARLWDSNDPVLCSRHKETPCQELSAKTFDFRDYKWLGGPCCLGPQSPLQRPCAQHHPIIHLTRESDTLQFQ